MNPSCASMAGGSRRFVSPANRKVRVFAAVALGLLAGAVVGAAAAAVGCAAAAAVGALVGAAAAAVGLAAGGAVGAVVGAAEGAAGPHAASRPMPAATPAMPRNRRRVSGEGGMAK